APAASSAFWLRERLRFRKLQMVVGHLRRPFRCVKRAGRFVVRLSLLTTSPRSLKVIVGVPTKGLLALQNSGRLRSQKRTACIVTPGSCKNGRISPLGSYGG